MKRLLKAIKNTRTAWNGNWTAIVLLVAFLSCGLLIASKFIHDLAVASGFRTLSAATIDLGREIHSHVRGDQKQLEHLARIIAELDEVDSRETRLILSTYKGGDMVSRLEILFPDDRVLLKDGTVVDATGRLSFAAEAEKGVHISDLEDDLGGRGKKVLRNYVPIRKNGEDAALLMGVADVERLPELYNSRAYGGRSHVYVLDGRSGDFLVDTWHNTLGNIKNMGRRKARPGNSMERMEADLAAGRSGNIAILSRTSGECLYAHYEPVGVNTWSVMLSAPESVVFEGARKIRAAFYVLASFVFIVCGCCFAWMLFKARKQTREKEFLLRQVRYMFAVEKDLFDAHRTPGRLADALREIAEMMEVEGAFFLILEKGLEKTPRLWTERGPREVPEEAGPDAAPEAACPVLYECLRHERSVILAGAEESCSGGDGAEALRECSRLHNCVVDSLMATLVEDADGNMAGILGVVNLRREWMNAEWLENVALSFSMALYNMKSYQKIKEMGMVDYLTGLLNRNSFQNAVAEHAYDSASFACVYVDVNGLHELNNSEGHRAGDRMLRFVADTLKHEFGDRDAYRIGGDEFVVFVPGEDEAGLKRKMDNVEQAVMARNYHISCGVAWRRREAPTQETVDEAERGMYEAKRRYYQGAHNRRGIR